MADRSLSCSLFRGFFRAYSVVLFETDIFRSGVCRWEHREVELKEVAGRSMQEL